MSPTSTGNDSTPEGVVFESVGPYRLLRRLGVGGMAETFRAVRVAPAGPPHGVCLKRLLPQHIPHPGYVELFLEEARLMAEMRCPQIVQVHELGAANGTHYIVMELVEGADLSQLLRYLAHRGERLSTESVLWVVRQLLRALDYAHGFARGSESLHLVHRDVSPKNLLIARTGDVKLTDFGIAKSTRRRHRTMAGTKGTLAYMSPEQVLGDDVAAPSDLFAVGILLFELLTTTHPFASRTDLQLLNNIVAGSRKSFSELSPDATPRVTALVEDLLQINPMRRPTAAEALERLHDLGLSPEGQHALAEAAGRYHRSVSTADVDLDLALSSAHSGICCTPTVLSTLPFEPAEQPRQRLEKPGRGAITPGPGDPARAI